jgi:predicted 3-demethylubiquinone-9 3-methyltransferase (glyoxalase superfamily)
MSTQSSAKTSTRSIAPCLAFVDRAEEAMNFYVSIFENSRIVSIARSESDGPIPKGKVIHGAFELNGREFTAFDGGEHFRFTDAWSITVTCDTQRELDSVWSGLAKGGKEIQCGWLTDRFGVSWQIVPTSLGKMMSNPKGGNVAKLMQSVMTAVKFDIAALEAAYRS